MKAIIFGEICKNVFLFDFFFYKYGIFVAKICKQALYESAVDFMQCSAREAANFCQRGLFYILWHLS